MLKAGGHLPESINNQVSTATIPFIVLSSLPYYHKETGKIKKTSCLNEKNAEIA